MMLEEVINGKKKAEVCVIRIAYAEQKELHIKKKIDACMCPRGSVRVH